MRRCLCGILKQGKTVFRTSEVTVCEQRSFLQQGTAGALVPVSNRSLLSNFTPICTASGKAGGFQNKNKSQRRHSSSSKQGGIGGLLSSVESKGEGFTESDVVSTWQQLADGAESLSQEDRESEIHKAKGFQTLVDMSIMATKRFSTEQLANIVMSAGQLGFDDDMLLDRISQNFMTRMSQVDAAELVTLATGLSLADHSPSVILFDTIQKRAVELASQFSADQKSSLEKAFKSFDYEHKEISSELGKS